MALQKRPYQAWFDATADIPIQQQGDDPGSLQFLPYAVANKRTITSTDGNLYTVGDLPVQPRGGKNIVWSSEGYTSPLNTQTPVPALTVNQKKASGLHTTNAGTGALDISAFSTLVLMINLASLTGTSPTIQFEYDMLDDAGTPNSLAIWKPAALSAAGALYVMIGKHVPWIQATAANTTVPANYAATAIPSGWTAYPTPITLSPNGQFQWTIGGTVSTMVWTAYIYGIN